MQQLCLVFVPLQNLLEVTIYLLKFTYSYKIAVSRLFSDLIKGKLKEICMLILKVQLDDNEPIAVNTSV